MNIILSLRNILPGMIWTVRRMTQLTELLLFLMISFHLTPCLVKVFKLETRGPHVSISTMLSISGVKTASFASLSVLKRRYIF